MNGTARRSAARTRTVIVGSGGSGAPLAARLSSDPSREVVLIEAGDAGDATPAALLDGGSLPGADPDHPANWAYPGILRDGRETVVARGRILGGSTTINGGYFIRATPSDFARWADAGGEAWAYEHALPILRALENDLDFGATAIHGGNGPVRVARASQENPAIRAFADAVRELGFSAEPDKNAGGAPGVGAVPSNIIDGVRWNTAQTYLDAARDRIEIHGGTRVLRVVFDRTEAPEGPPRAVGVDTDHGFLAADEVVLSAGGIATPHLLMLSGVGPHDDLSALGIPVVADLPVGTAFQDHPNLSVEWRTTGSIVDWEAGYGFPTVFNFDTASVDPSLTPRPVGDAEILLTAKPLRALITGARPEPETLEFLVALQEHRGRGRLSLRSADPAAPPRIEYHYLEHGEDRARMRAAVRMASRILQTSAFSEVFDGFTNLDQATIDADDALDAWISTHLGTALHTCATAPMGSVVDGAGNVFGVAGLRVADTSMLPSTPHRGPSNTSVFIGELIARRMITDPASAAKH